MKNYKMSKKEKKFLRRIIISLSVFLVLFLLDKLCVFSLFCGKYAFLLPFFLYFSLYLFIGHDVLKKAFLGIKNGQPLDENFLMTVASLGAFAFGFLKGLDGLSPDGFEEGCAVLLFFKAGEFLQNYATNKSRKNISSLLKLRPEIAYKKVKDGEKAVSPDTVQVGDVIVVKPGDIVPLDGDIINGDSAFDTKSLTGESLPIDLSVGDSVLSGSINLYQTVEIKVTKTFYNSTVNKILDLVENATDKKSKAENFLSRFARFFTPAVVSLAVIIAIIPSLIFGDWSTWIYRALNFLVVSCPCALVISVPLTFFISLGRASKNNILIKGSSYLEKFNSINCFVFDKTGTITKGNFEVQEIFPADKRDEILRLACIAEKDSSHPIAKSILSFCDFEIEKGYTVTNFSGFGVIAKKENNTIICGNRKFLEKHNIFVKNPNICGTTVYIAKNNEFLGYILIKDEIKDESKELLEFLSKKYKTVLLSGDKEESVREVAKNLNFSSFHYSLLPDEKLNLVESYKKQGNKVCFIGDGINDSLSLLSADVGISMGQISSDVAIESADIVLMKDDLKDIITLKKIAQKTMRIVFQNVFFTLSVKFLILILSFFGLTNMWIAVFGDVGVCFFAILNAMRANKKQKR